MPRVAHAHARRYGVPATVPRSGCRKGVGRGSARPIRAGSDPSKRFVIPTAWSNGMSGLYRPAHRSGDAAADGAGCDGPREGADETLATGRHGSRRIRLRPRHRRLPIRRRGSRRRKLGGTFQGRHEDGRGDRIAIDRAQRRRVRGEDAGDQRGENGRDRSDRQQRPSVPHDPPPLIERGSNATMGAKFPRGMRPQAARSRRRAVCWKNSAWLMTAETFAGWNGFAMRKAGSGRSPVRKRSG